MTVLTRAWNTLRDDRADPESDFPFRPEYLTGVKIILAGFLVV